MSWILRILLTLIGLVVGVFLLQWVASESGEVVVLSTVDSAGSSETRLWVADHEGAQYLRTGDPTSSWYRRLVANPRVGLVRGDIRMGYDAQPEPEMRDTVNRLLNEKYGWADDFIGLMVDWDNAVAVRLVPVPDIDPMEGVTEDAADEAAAGEAELVGE